MSTESFRRHTRRRVDAAIHRVYASLPHALFRELECFVRIAHARSDLLRTLPPRGRAFPALDALRNLACFPAPFTGELETWPGATGHPLFVIDSLARHVLGRYPVPRVLAQVWFGGGSAGELARRRWYVAHSGGTRFRELELPYEMTRRMEHVFLRSRHDLPLDHALRRAEVLGLGGTDELAATVCATRLGRSLARGAFWRPVIAWLVRHEAALAAAHVRMIVEYAEHTPDVALGAPAAVLDAAQRWQIQHRYAQVPRGHRLAWARTRWGEVAFVLGDERWQLLELIDSDQLRHEGAAMRHCVASYAARCMRGASSIWSLRCGERSVLTIEVEPTRGAITQVRGVRNSRGPHGIAADLVRRWAARERLALDEAVRNELARPRERP